jgi:hypothetical protein
VAEHRFEMGHNIRFSNTTILNIPIGYMDHLVKEAIKVRLHPKNFNGDGGFQSQSVLVPVTNVTKQY